MDNMNQSNMMDPLLFAGFPAAAGCASSSAQTTVITPTSGNPNLLLGTLPIIIIYQQGQQMQHKQLQEE
ncbi:MAG: hypothetical protein ACLS8R_06935 [Anaeromassilibacillus sp.]